MTPRPGTPRDWTPVYERFCAATDVMEHLRQIPGVLKVGIGARMRDAKFIDEMCFQVYVGEKRPASSLRSSERIPPMIGGFPTDVLLDFVKSDELRGYHDDFDSKTYSVRVGGTKITSSLGGSGTLGCFARRLSDNKVVALSNFHVLLSNNPKDTALSPATIQTILNAQLRVGQPKITKTLSCTCNDIGTIVAANYGVGGEIDAAIVLLDDGVPFYDKIRRVTKTDGTVVQSGVITGSAPAVPLNHVWKVGMKTGLTRGKVVTDPRPDVYIEPFTPNDPEWEQPEFPVSPPHVFGDPGDSGSVVVDKLSNKVVGLLKIRAYHPLDLNFNFGVATPIAKVLTAMQIRIDGDPALGTVDVAMTEQVLDLPAQSPFAAIVERVRDTRLGTVMRELVRTHVDEIVFLVNDSRPGKVAWQRLQGPSFIAALARSGKEPAYRIPAEIDGITRTRAVEMLRSMLMTHGSESLRQFVERHGAELADVMVRCDTLDAMIDAYEQLSPAVSAVHSLS